MQNTRLLALGLALFVAGVGICSASDPRELSLANAVPAAEIAWQKSYDKALEAAKAEHKVIFIAVNMDGEGANDRLAREVYSDATILGLAASTINVIASVETHAAAGGDCSRFKGIACSAHQACEKSVRGAVLKADETGNFVSPQHVFLDSAGKPLLSVPYEVSVEELAWCFSTAIRKADPTSKTGFSPGAHMPPRVVLGAVYDPSQAVGGAIQPLTKPEVIALIKEVKRGLPDEKRQVAFWRILHSDLPEAIDFIKAELRSGGAGPADRGGAGGGNSGAGQANGDGGGEKHKQILRAMGAVSPPVYWELAAEFVGADEDDLRLEAVVALEQMGAPGALKALEKQLAKEKQPAVKKDLVRAFAACGARDAKVRAAIVKRAKSEKDELVRVNTIVALGLVEQDADVRACMQEMLALKDDSARTAAAVAIALSRDDSYIAILETAKRPENSAGLVDALTRSLEVLHGGSIRRIQTPEWTLCKDTIPRERMFGRSDE